MGSKTSVPIFLINQWSPPRKTLFSILSLKFFAGGNSNFVAYFSISSGFIFSHPGQYSPIITKVLFSFLYVLLNIYYSRKISNETGNLRGSIAVLTVSFTNV